MSDRGFGGLARDTRLQNGRSLKDVADGLGKSIVYISDIERRNRRAPTGAVARRWAEIVGGDPDEFEVAAYLDRPAVELTVDHQDRNGVKNRVALELARRWDDISPTEADELDRLLGEMFRRGEAE